MGNDKTQKRKVQIISVLTLFAFLVDIYLIIYVPTDYILATAAFVTLVFTIITLNSWFKLKEIENHHREEQYADIMKAEKGAYVVTLEMMKEMNEKINFIGQKIMPLGKAGDENQRKIASMLDSIVEDQKKIAKITISRSKENADALMNSNDQLLVQMTAFRDSIDVIRDQVSKQFEQNGQGSGNIGEIKNELFDKIEELTESIKKEVDEISENIEISNQSVENLVSANKMAIQKEEVTAPEPALSEESMSPQTMEEEAVIPEAVEEEAVVPEAVKEEPVIPEAIEEEAVIPEAMPSEIVQTEDEPVIPETIEIDGNDVISELIMEKKSLDEAILTEESPIEESAPETSMPDPNKPMSPEDIAALLASTTEQSSSESTAQVNFSENVAETAPSESQAAPTEDSKPSMPDMSDPNKPMSPEDIAALISNTATENLPEETVKFEEEEKPPVPDMSDPNKPMSPEDIAALIANM